MMRDEKKNRKEEAEELDFMVLGKIKEPEAMKMTSAF